MNTDLDIWHAGSYWAYPRKF